MPPRIENELAKDFALTLRRLRAAKGLTVRALAEAVGASEVTIWKWEGGSSKPRPRMLASIAHALDIDPSVLAAGLTDFGDLERGMRAAETKTVPRPQPGKGFASSPRSPVTSPVELCGVVSQAKEMIARASGVAVNQVAVRIEF